MLQNELDPTVAGWVDEGAQRFGHEKQGGCELRCVLLPETLILSGIEILKGSGSLQSSVSGVPRWGIFIL